MNTESDETEDRMATIMGGGKAPLVDMSEHEDAAIRVYLEAIRSGYGPIMAARLVNSTAAEIERFARLNEPFAQSVREAVDESLERVESKVKESAQEGDMTAAKLVLESHLPEKWSKPDREMLVRLGAPVEIDVADLHSRLKALDAGQTIDTESEEVTDG